MKDKYLRFSMVAVLICVWLSGSAHKESLFMEATSLPNLEHTFMSGDMLKSMGSLNFVSSRLKLDCKDLKSYDIIETSYSKSREELWKVMKKVIKKEKLDRLAGTRTVNSRTTILGKLNGKGDTFSKLMLVEQGPGQRLYILYLTGKIKCSDLNLKLSGALGKGSLDLSNWKDIGSNYGYSAYQDNCRGARTKRSQRTETRVCISNR